MSETMITVRQCTECRRIHPLGTCFYGISNGKITKFPKGHKGNEPKNNNRKASYLKDLEGMKSKSLKKLRTGRFSLKYYLSELGYKKINGVWTKLS